jgi:hypothetical protein
MRCHSKIASKLDDSDGTRAHAYGLYIKLMVLPVLTALTSIRAGQALLAVSN